MAEDLGLGRMPENNDPRDRRYSARELGPELLGSSEWLTAPLDTLGNPAHLGTRYWNDNGLWTDQGSTGTCVGHGTLIWAEDAPIMHPDQEADPFEWYRAICLLDQWAENDNGDLQFGSSVHAAAKFLTQRGHITTYLWIGDLDTAIRWLLTQGPLLVGTTWLNSMFRTARERDARGTYRSFVKYNPEHGVAGGHCYLWNGVNIWAECIRVKLGSWNRAYFGVNGRSNLHLPHAAALIADWGEIMASHEVRGVPLRINPLHEDTAAM